MTVLLDTGALIAFERGSRTVQAFLERAYRRGEAVGTTTAVVAQAWRDDARQARLASLLGGVDEHELTTGRARRVGRLLRLAGTADVVDASIVDVANDGDEILTSDLGDLGDIERLAQAAGKTLIVTRLPAANAIGRSEAPQGGGLTPPASGGSSRTRTRRPAAG